MAEIIARVSPSSGWDAVPNDECAPPSAHATNATPRKLVSKGTYLSRTETSLPGVNESAPTMLPSSKVKNPLELPKVVQLPTLVYPSAATKVQFAANHTTANSIDRNAVSTMDRGGKAEAGMLVPATSGRSASCSESVPVGSPLRRASEAWVDVVRPRKRVWRGSWSLSTRSGNSPRGVRPSIDDGRLRRGALCDRRRGVAGPYTSCSLREFVDLQWDRVHRG